MNTKHPTLTQKGAGVLLRISKSVEKLASDMKKAVIGSKKAAKKKTAKKSGKKAPRK